MSKSPFLKPNHPILKKFSKEVPENKINSPEIKRIIERMLRIAYGQRSDRKKPVLMGLAAPQIGISKKIILVAIGASARKRGRRKIGKLKAYINPKILWKSKREDGWVEGCYSTSRVCGIVKRSLSIKVKAFEYNLTHGMCKVVTGKYTGFTARIFQHEIDHLKGKVFVDKITDPDKLHWVSKSDFLAYRKNQAWKNWPKKCSFEKWNRIKN